jgi:hypothetical protein
MMNDIQGYISSKYGNDSDMVKLNKQLTAKRSQKSLDDLSEEEFIQFVGRENAERLRSVFNEMRIGSGQGRSLAVEFAEFAIKKDKGNTYKVTEKDIELFYLGSREISADVDTWGKAQKGTFRLDNFNYNMKIPPIRKNFETEAAFQEATKEFESALVRQDKYDVFINYPIPPDLLSTGGVPSRLSKHFYEHLNTGFSQRLKDDYPLSIQVMVGGEVKILKIDKGPDSNIHAPFIKQLESFAQEGIFLPLNPVDLIKNLKDYQPAINTAPNLARFTLKFFDDFAINSPGSGAIKNTASKMGLDVKDLPSAKLLYQSAKKSVDQNQTDLADELKFDDSGRYSAMIKRLDIFFKGT